MAEREAVSLVKAALTKDQLEEFKKLPWGHLVSVSDMQFSGQIIHSLLLRLVKDQPKDELWFLIQGRLLKFTYADFCRISGLKSSAENPVFNDDEEVHGTLIDLYFRGSTNITYKMLKDKLKSFRRTKKGDPVKLVSVCYIMTALIARDNKTKINLDYFKWADEFEKFKMYPWGLESYNTMIDNFKSIMKEQPTRFRQSKASCAKFTLYGCPFILQVWAYENVPNLGEQCAERIGNEEIPMLNWKADGFFHARKLNELVFKDNDDVEDESENDNLDEEVQDRGFKAKVIDEIQALQEHVAALESRLKLMEDRFREQGGVPEKETEVGSQHKDEVDCSIGVHAEAGVQEVEDEPAPTEEVGAAVGEPPDPMTVVHDTTNSNEIISSILIEVTDVVTEPSAPIAVVDDENNVKECDATTASNHMISPALLEVAAAELTPCRPAEDGFWDDVVHDFQTLPIQIPTSRNIHGITYETAKIPIQIRGQPFYRPKSKAEESHH
ncbi:unnamed protein product [Cuscuta epithymum]|uniref:DUF1985 domain-containing protein n=1 Tax=Cuscuta epithymum TaxID=186058 RepID=A0AAV0CGT6_9ASTE|nr:unnamed protein product [Cuscuta epithymum]